MLDLRRLQYLNAIHRYHSFTKASEELFVSQSSVSIAIKSLEKELEVKLIARTPKGIEFTPEGEELVVYARRILQECRQAEARMADLSAGKKVLIRHPRNSGTMMIPPGTLSSQAFTGTFMIRDSSLIFKNKLVG